jgi:tetratricopeptide (TPR) repeat protein
MSAAVLCVSSVGDEANEAAILRTSLSHQQRRNETPPKRQSSSALIRAILIAAAPFLLVACATVDVQPDAAGPERQSVAQAQARLLDAHLRALTVGFHGKELPVSSVSVAGVKYRNDRAVVFVSIADDDFPRRSCMLAADSFTVKFEESEGLNFHVFDGQMGSNPCGFDLIEFNSQEDAQRFDNAAYRISIASRAEIAQTREQSEKLFAKDVAEPYRAANPKPDVPQQAQEYLAGAMDAQAHHRYGDAMAMYMGALKIAPWIPVAHYNLAKLLAQSGMHDDAKAEMKEYSMLAPQAPAASAARQAVAKPETTAGGQAVNPVLAREL